MSRKPPRLPILLFFAAWPGAAYGSRFDDDMTGATENDATFVSQVSLPIASRSRSLLQVIANQKQQSLRASFSSLEGQLNQADPAAMSSNLLIALDSNRDGGVDAHELSIFAEMQGMDPQQAISEFFNMDGDHDGTLNRIELEAAISDTPVDQQAQQNSRSHTEPHAKAKPEAVESKPTASLAAANGNMDDMSSSTRNVMVALDSNRDGLVDAHEISVFAEMQNMDPKQMVQEFFSADADHDGSLSLDELKVVLGDTQKPEPNGQTATASPSGHGAVASVGDTQKPEPNGQTIATSVASVDDTQKPEPNGQSVAASPTGHSDVASVWDTQKPQFNGRTVTSAPTRYSATASATQAAPVAAAIPVSAQKPEPFNRTDLVSASTSHSAPEATDRLASGSAPLSQSVGSVGSILQNTAPVQGPIPMGPLSTMAATVPATLANSPLDKLASGSPALSQSVGSVGSTLQNTAPVQLGTGAIPTVPLSTMAASVPATLANSPLNRPAASPATAVPPPKTVPMRPPSQVASLSSPATVAKAPLAQAEPLRSVPAAAAVVKAAPAVVASPSFAIGVAAPGVTALEKRPLAPAVIQTQSMLPARAIPQAPRVPLAQAPPQIPAIATQGSVVHASMVAPLMPPGGTLSSIPTSAALHAPQPVAVASGNSQ